VIRVWIDGLPRSEIGVADRGLQYGDGVFETLAVIDGDCPWFGLHYQRLLSGCERLQLPLPDKTRLLQEIRQAADGYERAVIKLIMTSGSGGRGYARPGRLKPTRIIILHPWPGYPTRYWQQGVRVYKCRITLACNPTLAGIKHLNRLEQVLARQEWRNEDYAEGLMHDQHGNVIEGTMSNVFLVHNNVLHTPDLKRCGVDGVTRRQLVALAREAGIETVIADYTEQDFYTADEIMLSNSLIGIWPVREYENRQYQPGPVYRLLLGELVRDYPITNV
jgi:4-amino-4-deoxychorismate lyase